MPSWVETTPPLGFALAKLSSFPLCVCISLVLFSSWALLFLAAFNCPISRFFMELGGGFRVKSRGRVRDLSGINVRLDSESHLVIELPASWVLHYVTLSVFFAFVILTLPFVGLILKTSFGNCLDGVDSGVESELMSSFELVEALIEDLSQEGLMMEVDKALIVGAGNAGDVSEDLWFRSGNELHLAEDSHLMDQSLIPDETYDFALVSTSLDAKYVDRVMKVGGIVAAPLVTDCWNEFLEKSNYKIVHFCNLEPTVVAARKIRPLNLNQRAVSLATRRLCEVMPEDKDSASMGLADSLLEPPRRALVRSREYLSRINDLPESLSNVLRGRYHPHISITNDWSKVNAEVTGWFYENYPTRNQPLGNREITSRDDAMPLNLAHWQMDGIEEEEHATTKAQAEVVEELLNNRVIRSANELFMECYHQWGVRDDDRRTFWECMSLYGRMKDGGVAVQQWWD